ncbi:MAG: hypothetical protein MJZ25_08825 [Fibrobacter sp.]|nr:hypothetical protein [Fibrobacter sp.]
MDFKSYCASLAPIIQKKHESVMHRRINLETPKRFSEKLEYLKIYDSTFLKTYCTDKITAKEYVTRILHTDITIPTLRTFDNVDQLMKSINKLPSNCVIKTNHGSHTNIFMRNGHIQSNAGKLLTAWLKKDWTWYGYEMHYLPIPRKILVEPLMSDNRHQDLIDYKFGCFNGVPVYCQVIGDRNGTNKYMNYYDMNWKPCVNIDCSTTRANYRIHDTCPQTFDLMVEYAKILSKPFKFVRVDFYEINGQLYFGELTFIPCAAYFSFTNDSIDYMFGELLHL